MKQTIALCVIGLCLALCCGCEWTGGGGVDYWDSSADWVDFSGTYKGVTGAYAVVKFGTGSEGESSTNYTSSIVTGELLGTANGSATAFGGYLAHPCVAGSLNIQVGAVGGYRFWDSSGESSGTASLSVTPDDGSSGSINYDTGAWSLNFPAPLASGAKIIASYTYVTATVINPPAQQANHGKPIYSFVVYQTGNNVQLIDSNGSVYNGTMGSVRASGGHPSDYVVDRPEAGPVEAQFSATGVSQGYNVTITGIFDGWWSEDAIENRRMTGNFIEEDGYEGDIIAYCQEAVESD